MATTPKDFILKYDLRKQNPFEKLHPEEPWFFIRAQDKLSPEAVIAYADLLKRESDKALAAGDEDKADLLLKQAMGVQRVAGKFLDWQQDNQDKVKLPD